VVTVEEILEFFAEKSTKMENLGDKNGYNY
jgi:hypothetical protein